MKYIAGRFYKKNEVVVKNGKYFVALDNTTADPEKSKAWKIKGDAPQLKAPERVIAGVDVLRGEKGEKGEKGDKGERGPIGLKGDRGDMGLTGPQGERGDKGDNGRDGKDGKDGLNGKDGANGINGVSGKDGINGANGVDGKDGLSIYYRWDGTKLGIRREDEQEFQYVDLKSDAAAAQIALGGGGRTRFKDIVEWFNPADVSVDYATKQISIVGGGGGGTPGGSDTNIQYNNSGAFAGDEQFVWDDVGKVLNIGLPTEDVLTFSGSTLTKLYNGDTYAQMNFQGDGHLYYNNTFSSRGLEINGAADDPASELLLLTYDGDHRCAITGNGEFYLYGFNAGIYLQDYNFGGGIGRFLLEDGYYVFYDSGGDSAGISCSNLSAGSISTSTIGGLSSIFSAQGVFTAGSTSTKPLIAKGMAGQIANLFEAQNSAGTTLASISPAGRGRFINLTVGNTGAEIFAVDPSIGKATLSFSSVLGWTNVSTADTSPDTGIGKNAIGIVEINNGTLGTWRSLRVGAAAAGTVALITRGITGQTAPIQEWHSSTGVVLASIGATGKQSYDATNTAAGTTGNQTINKPSGTVNFAAGATTLTVTNSLVSSSSIVVCTVLTNDATAVFKNAVPVAGSFSINLTAAATAETKVGFIVYN